MQLCNCAPNMSLQRKLRRHMSDVLLSQPFWASFEVPFKGRRGTMTTDDLDSAVQCRSEPGRGRVAGGYARQHHHFPQVRANHDTKKPTRSRGPRFGQTKRPAFSRVRLVAGATVASGKPAVALRMGRSHLLCQTVSTTVPFALRSSCTSTARRRQHDHCGRCQITSYVTGV